MERRELETEIAACMDAFRVARDQVEATELRMARAFASAGEDDQLWFVGRALEMLGTLVKETEAKTPPTDVAAVMRVMQQHGLVH